MGKDMMMSTKEVQRFALIQQVLSKTTTQRAAASALGLSERQIKRLCRQMPEHGAAGLISQRRGQTSNQRIPQLQRDHFVGLVRQHYGHFGQSWHANTWRKNAVLPTAPRPYAPG
jgi:transposase